MKKTFVYLGIILMIASFAVVALSGSIVNPGKLITQKNLTVTSAGFSYVQFTIPNSLIVFLVARMSKPANFYVLNGSGFAQWSSEVAAGNSPNGYNLATALDGAGTFFAYRNASEVLIPSTAKLYNSTPTYSYNSIGLVPAGTYYAVVDNTNGSRSSSSQINATVVYLPESSAGSGGLTSLVYDEAIIGLSFFILLIAGIIILIYGLLKKDSGLKSVMLGAEKKKGEVSDDQIDELYRNIRKKRKKGDSG